MWLLRLIRWPNLIIIILTQVLVRHCVISPFLHSVGMNPHLAATGFVLLVLATAFIAAAGYVINDYFDQQIDRINKPDRMIIGIHISARRAIMMHWVLNGLAILLGFIASKAAGSLKLGLIFLLITAMLWMYSARHKRRLISGNLVVSFLSAMVVLIVWLLEYFALLNSGQDLPGQVRTISVVIWFYAAFAFLVTLVREIVKDIEDMEGDAAIGCQTLPVSAGIPFTKNVAMVLTIITMALLAFGQYLLFLKGLKLILWYYLIPVQLLLINLIIQINKAASPAEFRTPGNLAKITMVAGILGMQLFSISIN